MISFEGIKAVFFSKLSCEQCEGGDVERAAVPRFVTNALEESFS
jgi:hypothetical protein